MNDVKIAYSDFPASNYEHFYITEAMRSFCNPVISDDPDIVFYSCYARGHMRFRDVVKVFFNGENVHPDFNECDYAISCQPMRYGNRYFRLTEMALHLDESVNDRSALSVGDKSRFCNFIYSNDHVEQHGGAGVGRSPGRCPIFEQSGFHPPLQVHDCVGEYLW